MLRHDGYVVYDGALPAELEDGQQPARAAHPRRRSSRACSSTRSTTARSSTTSPTGRCGPSTTALDLENRGCSCTTAVIAEKPNPVHQDEPARARRARPEAGRPDLARAHDRTPSATAAWSRSTSTCSCANSNCITRTVTEDVPPRFYDDAGTIRCRYCRRAYTVHHRKVTEGERAAYLASLPKRIEPVPYTD